jgi:outer membrane protein insertion porin family
LKKGQEIVIPGEEISNAIKLGKLGLFSDMIFYVTVVGDSILNKYMELPKLNEVKFNGVKR